MHFGKKFRFGSARSELANINISLKLSGAGVRSILENGTTQEEFQHSADSFTVRRWGDY